ncbi:MAG: hypothetical protein ACD_75C00352G0004 [uncultured bacterium]|nr:MAG: hypothetical protein ACD_75C00352G0004 [uncultured bacterium]
MKNIYHMLIFLQQNIFFVDPSRVDELLKNKSRITSHP